MATCKCRQPVPMQSQVSMYICASCSEKIVGPDPRDAEIAALKAEVSEQTARAEKAEALVERAEVAFHAAIARANQALAANAEMRAALENLVALIQRDGLQPDPPDPNAAVRVVNHKIRRDWACRGCRPDSDVLKDGFLCSYHRVQALLSRPDLGAGMVLVPRESIDEWRDLITDLVFDLDAHSRARKAVADLDALLEKAGG